jgi:hypothetical protein
MTFEEILDQAIAMLQRRGRLTYSTLKRQFQLDDAALDDLVVYLSPADKYHRLTHRPSQGQKGLDERAIMTSPWSSHPW